jgi:beta-phosphoglucomutase-like phosphatase (HAD superfamily)
LLPFFKDRIYSAYDIGSWKPEPGLFLHAANSLGAEPVRCAVVEDSVTGVIAGIAAGMTVFGYSSPEDAAALEDAGAIPVSHLGDLISVLGSRDVRSV